jgi:hypothetical protein
MNYLTKWPEAFTIQDQKTETLAKIFVEEVCCRHGMPVKIITDMGSNFMSGFFKDVCRILNVEKVNTTAYNPRGNGLIERFNKTLGSALKKAASADHKTWDDKVPFILFAYRTSLQTSTKASPFLLTYGREPKLPIDIVFEDPNEEKLYAPEDYRRKIVELSAEARDIAKNALMKEQIKAKHLADRLRITPHIYKQGDLVLLKNENHDSKLDIDWTGPYVVKELEEYGNILISHKLDAKDVQLVNPRRIKAYHEQEKKKDEHLYEVEKIIGQRGQNDNLEYKVRWRGYSAKHDSWIEASNKENSIEDLIQDWQEKNYKKRNRGATVFTLACQLNEGGVMDRMTHPSGIPKPHGPKPHNPKGI